MENLEFLMSTNCRPQPVVGVVGEVVVVVVVVVVVLMV